MKLIALTLDEHDEDGQQRPTSVGSRTSTPSDRQPEQRDPLQRHHRGRQHLAGQLGERVELPLVVGQRRRAR